MDTKTYTITLSDGTVISDLTLNGNNYISKTPVDAAIFVGNCSPVVISDGENEETHENAECVQVAQYGDEYWIVLRDLSEQEIRDLKTRSGIDYIAMMADIDLEEA